MKHVFIVNPASASGKTGKALPVLRELVQKQQLDHVFYVTEHARHAQEIASEIHGDACIYAIGGDGTAHEVLNGLQDGVTMSIVPCGTGNDFYRMISNQVPDSLEERLQQAIDGQIVEIDYGISDRCRFLNTTTVGFDADINLQVNTKTKTSKIPAKLLYLLTALMELVHVPQYHAEITFDEETIETDFLLLAVMNGRYYGGGFNPTPNSELDDGYFDICLVQPLKRLRILTLLSKYSKGQHTQISACRMLRAKHVKIKTVTPIAGQTDGEDFLSQELQLDCRKKALHLKVPRHSFLIK